MNSSVLMERQTTRRKHAKKVNLNDFAISQIDESGLASGNGSAA
ncbi:hypothetical protein [Pararhizobium sp. A13]